MGHFQDTTSFPVPPNIYTGSRAWCNIDRLSCRTMGTVLAYPRHPSVEWVLHGHITLKDSGRWETGLWRLRPCVRGPDKRGWLWCGRGGVFTCGKTQWEQRLKPIYWLCLISVGHGVGCKPGYFIKNKTKKVSGFFLILIRKRMY